PSQRQVAVSSVSSLSNDSAGVVHAIEPSGRAEAIPASFSELPARNSLDDQCAGLVEFLHTRRDSKQQARNLLLRADQISRGALVAKRATADLLSRCIHTRNSLTPHGDQSTMMELQRASKSLRESSNHVFA